MEGKLEFPKRLSVVLALASLAMMGSGINLVAEVVLDETSSGFAYEVVDGLAVFDGDILLGIVDEIESSQRREPRAWFRSRSQSRVSERERLWQEGIVPYVVDSNIHAEQVENINWAVEEWNSKTVITLRPRTTETDYVRFVHAESGLCSSYVGRKGGEQSILLPSYACGADGVAHEIGHAVGLWHEHQRADRDEYVMYQSEDPNWMAASSDSPRNGPYDYASIMHYSSSTDPHTGRLIKVSIPPGIPLGSSGRGLSAGDIDGIARMYGDPPEVTTISTNPPGLIIIVDGEDFVAPASFDWEPDSQHSVEVPSPQTVGDVRWLFGRWNDGGGRRHTVTDDPDRTWFEANFIKQVRLRLQVEPEGSGLTQVIPESPDGFYTVNSPIEIRVEPDAESSFEFRGWHGDHVTRPSSNPASIVVDPFFSSMEYTAYFDSGPLFRIETNVDSEIDPSGLDSILARLDDRVELLPIALPVSEFPSGSVTVGADETQSTYRYWRRYQFDNWSDGGSISHEVKVPSTGGELALNLTPFYRLRVRSEGLGAVNVSPESDDGFYSRGTEVSMNAVPGPDWHFAGWTGGDLANSPVQTVVMDSEKSFLATFSVIDPSEPSVDKIIGPMPRAFTFVAPAGLDPASQRMKVVHQIQPLQTADGVPWMYRIKTDQSWLSVNPTEWSDTGSGQTEIEVAVHSASLVPDTHNGTLTIVRFYRSNDAIHEGLAVGVPVTFVVTPALATSTAQP